jgi:hypothetical protein
MSRLHSVWWSRLALHKREAGGQSLGGCDTGDGGALTLVSCNIPWNVVANPQFLLFRAKYVPGAKIPNHQELSNRILKEHVKTVEGDMKAVVKGKLATGQCDGWKNISKTPLIAMVIQWLKKLSQCLSNSDYMLNIIVNKLGNILKIFTCIYQHINYKI